MVTACQVFISECSVVSIVNKHLLKECLVCLTVDLFLTCQDDNGEKSFQIWINDKERGFVHSVGEKLPQGTGQISFADLGRYATLFNSVYCYDRKVWYSKPLY